MATEQPPKRKRQPKPRLKHYDLEDAQLLSRSRTLRQHLLDNLAAFTAFDADLNNTRSSKSSEG